MKINFSFFLSICSRCCVPGSWAARHTTMCLDNWDRDVLCKALVSGQQDNSMSSCDCNESKCTGSNSCNKTLAISEKDVIYVCDLKVTSVLGKLNAL